jgi:hypothetical protein
LGSWLILSEDNYCTWKWSAVIAPPKANAATQKSNLSAHGVFMPPRRIRSRRDEADHKRAALECLAHPAPNFSSVWRVHPAFAVPFLRKAVFGLREISGALRVFWRGAHVQVKAAEFIGQRSKKREGRFPFVRPA